MVQATSPPPPSPPEATTTATTLDAQVVVVGGGPAGLVAALLFARAGASVLVLESHADFLRDFRGDTIHPSTLELFAEMGYLDEFLALPHDRATDLCATFSDAPGQPTLRLADFSRLKNAVRCPFVAFMPQHAFLDFLDKKAAEFGPARYRCVRSAKATGLIFEDGDEAGGRVVGVRARRTDGSGGELVARASALVVAADGRRSAVREAARLPPAVFPGGVPAPMDVLWFRLPRGAAAAAAGAEPPGAQGFVSRGAFVVAIGRGTYYQMGLVCQKGGADGVRDAGLKAFARRVAAAVPFLTPERVEAAVPRFFGGGGGEGGGEGDGGADGNNNNGGGGGDGGNGGRDVHVLDVRVDRLPRWHRPGLICIGDAAHSMSPVGGVGVNLAVQDAVALANAVAGKVGAAAGGGGGGGAAAEFCVSDTDLEAVQRRRELPTRVTQALQVAVQRRVIGRLLAKAAASAAGNGGEEEEEEGESGVGGGISPLPPLPLRLMQRLPALQWLPARLVGIGVRPENIRCPMVAPSAPA